MRPLLFLVALAAATASAQSDGLTLVGQLDPHPGSYSDVWGYVGTDGREYALLASWLDGGLNVIDVTDAVPVLEEHLPVNGDGSDVEGYGHYAYVTSNGNPTSIIDLSDPTDPVLVGTFGTGTHTLSIADGYLYANGSGGVRIYSLANPTAPAFVGQYNPYYVHDVLVRGDTMYTAGIYGDGVDIVDVSNKATPVLIARFDYPGSGAHNVCADASGSYLFVGDEIGTGPWTRVFDVRDPHNVELVAEIIVNPGAIVHNCHVKGDLLFLGHYTEGGRVWDVSDPENPFEIAYYDTYPGGGGGFNGAWSFYPHLPSGKLLVSDMQTGLYVLRLDDPPGPSVTAELDPVNPPVVLPPSGGAFAYTARVTNDGPSPQAFDAWVTATLPSGSERRVAGPVAVTLPAGASAQRTLSLRVPAAAPAGLYTLTLAVGDYPSVVDASDSFTFTKLAAEAAAEAAAAGPGDPVSEGAFFGEAAAHAPAHAPAASAAASASAARVRLEVYPNPSRGRGAVGFALAAGGAVRLSVLDALGREVAVLAEGVLGAGDHAYAFEGAALPAGLYLARLEVGGRVETQRFTVVR